MEYKDLSVVAESTLKFAKEEAEREYEKIRQKYINKREENAVHLTTSVEEYENALSDLRLHNLRKNLNAYFDKNPKLYDYVRALNVKKEMDFKNEHNKIHRHDVGSEIIMKEIATRRHNNVQAEAEIEKTKYLKDKFEKIEQEDYQFHLEYDRLVEEITKEHHCINPIKETYESFYQQMLADYEKICLENKQVMDSLFSKVEVLVKENYEKVALTQEKTEINEVRAQRDQKARDLLALNKEYLENNVDVKVLKVQLHEKLPVEEDLKTVEEKKKEFETEIQKLETEINALNRQIQEMEQALVEKRKKLNQEFINRDDFASLEDVTKEEASILKTINSCFVKETDEVFVALINTINDYAKKTFKTFDVYKAEKLAIYNQKLLDYKQEKLAELPADADELTKKAYSLSTEDYIKFICAEKIDAKQKNEEIKQNFLQEKAQAKEAYLNVKKQIKEAKKERKKTYLTKKVEAKQKLKIVTSSFAKTEIRDTLLVYKKEINEGDKAKYKKARKNYNAELKKINQNYKLALIEVQESPLAVLLKKEELKEKESSQKEKVYEKELNKDLNKQISLNRYRKNMNKTQRENILGYIFLSVWAIGFLILTLYPLIYTIFLSFSQVSYNLGYDPVFFGNGKVFPNWIGFKNYSDLFFNNTSFLYEKLPTFLMSMAFFLPIVVFIAFVLAMLLNTKIIGRTAFRLIYFLPVIIISGPLLNMLNGSGGDQSTIILTIDGTFIYEVLKAVFEKAVEYANFVFRNFIIILWMTGVPIVLFISGLQKIDRSLYEAAEIDGANKWQALWTVTYPLIKSVILIACLFTIVQIATIDITWINPIKSSGGDTANPGIVEIMSGSSSPNYGMAAAMAWIQTLIVLIFVGIVFALFREKEFVVKEKSYEEVERIKAKKAHRKAQLSAFFHVDAIKRGWNKTTAPFVKWHHTRKMKAKKRQEEKEG